jgi:branched-chain amino acid transport system ATP-binding protein
MPNAPILEVIDLRLSFGGITALTGVSFKVNHGEIIGLVGANGSGKTSLLNVVNGLYKPEWGGVLFEGKDITGQDPHKIAGLGIARSFQHAELFRNMSVLENLLVGCHTRMKGNLFSCGLFWGLAEKEEIAFRRRADEVIQFLKLERYRKQRVANLSAGVMRLVGLARALCMQPKIMLLDEVSSGLNRQEKKELARVLLRIKNERHIPILWVEHDVKLIGDLADRLVVLHYGHKIAEGSLDEVSDDPQVVKAFLGGATTQGEK